MMTWRPQLICMIDLKFDLSEKMIRSHIKDRKMGGFFLEKDVKEFIKILKEYVNRFDKNQMTNLITIIDKLAGKELI